MTSSGLVIAQGFNPDYDMPSFFCGEDWEDTDLIRCVVRERLGVSDLSNPQAGRAVLRLPHALALMPRLTADFMTADMRTAAS